LPRAFEVWTSSNPTMWKILVCPAFYPSNPSVFVFSVTPSSSPISLLACREKKRKKKDVFFPSLKVGWGGGVVPQTLNPSNPHCL
jgi:hypothetical protein